jgi:uncharacterized protein (TIGR02246 family)
MRFPGLSAVLLTFALPLFAEQPDRSGWQYDAVVPGHLSDTASPASADINAVNDVLAKMLKCWNAKDLTGYLSVLWNSPQLIIILDNEQLQGWDAVSASYRAGFSDPNTMGDIKPLRTQVRVTKPGLALVQDEWMVHYPSENKQVVGSSTMTLQKLEGTWKVISSYSRFSPATSRGWEFDSIAPEQSAATPSAERDELKAIDDLLVRMDASWNAHDIDGVMSAYWNSPQLLLVIQEEQFQGWEMLYHAYKTGYPDTNAMGHVDPSRVQIRLLKSDIAVAVNWWTVTYPNSKVRVIGNTTMNLQKFDAEWKIVMAHSSFAEP